MYSKFTFFILVAFSAWTWPVFAAEPARFLITENGAVADGKTLNTAAIQATIDRCATAGGGEVVVPSGVFLSGALFFKQGVNLRVDKGGVLKATSTPRDFPPLYTRWEGVERYWTSAFLNFVGMTEVMVQGEGLIDGSGDGWPARQMRDRTVTVAAPARTLPSVAEAYGSALPKTSVLNLASDPAHLPGINAAGIALPGQKTGHPRTLVFQDCRNVTVKNLNFKNEASWCVVFIYCEEGIAEHLTIRAEHNLPSSDGIDIDSCRHIRVTGCDIDCNDDCISLKSGKDEDGLRVNRPCEDIVIEKTIFAYGHGGAAMGSETSGGIRNVEIRDCVAAAGNWAPIRFKSQPSRGGVVENIVYRNFEIRDARQVFEFTLAWRMVPPIDPPAKVLPLVRNVRLINVHGTAQTLGSIHGLKDSPITGVVFENCELAAESGLILENTREIDTTGLHAKIKEGPAVITRESRD